MADIRKFVADHLLEAILVGLILFIPLYPKWPLFDVAFTWTYIRLEDVLVGISFIALAGFLIFKKVSLKSFLSRPIYIFWVVGLISTIYALATLGWRDNWAIYKPHLIVLHFLRRIEYLGVFFVALVAINYAKRAGIKRFLIGLIVGLVGVIIYGIGQKYLGFCSYLTMNEEFAKGVCIPLQTGTRISSTFGGHYDLAGYLVMTLPLVASLFFVTKNFYYRLGIAIVLFGGFFTMLLTSSRISFFALIVSFALFTFIVIKQKRMIVFGVIGVLILTLVFGRSTIVDRFSKTIRFKDVVVEKSTGKIMEIPTRDKDWGGLPESDRVVLLPFFQPVATDSAYQVTKYEKGSEQDKQAATAAGTVRQAVDVPQSSTKETDNNSKKEIIEEVRVVKGDFEKHKALIFDISFTTRIDGGWPKTLQAFAENPILGRGYSTVTAAVDSSFVRALGEVGLAGFISFFGIFVIFIQRARKYIATSNDRFLRMFVIGTLCGVVGLLINGLLIDIFEASKVAYVLWMILGVAVWIIERNTDTTSTFKK